MTFEIVKPFLFTALRVFSVVVYVLTLAAAYGGHVNPNYFTFPALLTLAFPYFAIATLILTVTWACLRKLMFCALGVGTVFLCIGALSVAFPLGFSRKPDGDGKVFKIISWNVIHTRDLRKPDYPGNRAVEFMINSDADIITLAELRGFNKDEMPHLTESLKDSLFAAYPYRAGLESTDIKILSKYPVERLNIISYDHYGNAMFDFFQVSFPQNELIVAMLHLYSYDLSAQEREVVTDIKSVETARSSVSEFKGSILSKMGNAFKYRAEAAKILREALDKIPKDKALIVCGDFNDVPLSWAYNLIRGDDFKDAYAETNFGPAITYNLHAFYFHIDQMLYRGPLKALDLTVDKINSSDHYPLVGEFQFKEAR